MDNVKLHHFAFSHFSEKVRWALDYKNIPYTHHLWPPGTHAPSAVMRTGQSSLPILKHDGRWIHDSTRIIALLEEQKPAPNLYPSDEKAKAEALAWEDDLDENLGPATRALFLDAVIDHPEFIADQSMPEKPPFYQLGKLFAMPAIMLGGSALRGIAGFGQLAGINEVSFEQGKEKTEQFLQRIETRIKDHDFLVGEQFSIADLTAAALLSPIADFSNHPYPIRGKKPKSVEKLHEKYGKRKAVRWAENLYRKYRPLKKGM